MMATQTLTQRGHQVVLFEEKDHLGGHLPDICELPFKDDLKQYTQWDVRTTLNSGADIRLNTRATPEIVRRENPDALIIATGSHLAKPPIPGIDGENVVDVISVDSGKATITGENVLICGGGMSGLECALGLAMQGKKVTVLDMVPVEDFAKEIVNFTRNMLMMLLKEHHVKLIGGEKVQKITAGGVETIDRDWVVRFHEADTVVTAFGLIANDQDMEALMDIVPETYAVGDCWYGAKTIGNANTTAFNFAMEI